MGNQDEHSKWEALTEEIAIKKYYTDLQRDDSIYLDSFW